MILPGKCGDVYVHVTPLGAATLAGPVTFAATGFPVGSTVTFAPPTVAAGSGVTTVVMSVAVPAGVVMMQPVRPFSERAPIALALLLLPIAMLRRGRKRLRGVLAMMLLMAMATAFTGCLTDKASGYFGTVPKNYSITTATSGTVSHAAAPVTLTDE